MGFSVVPWKGLPEKVRERILRRSETDISQILPAVSKIIEGVKKDGDRALIDYTLKFDKTDIASLGLRVREEEFEEAERTLSGEVKDAISFGIKNTRLFHEGQLPKGLELTEIIPGLLSGERATPIDSAGLYVPRGRGSFPSMLYMLALPAKVAGVSRISVITPPGPCGKIDPGCLFAARLCGITEIYRVGGAHGIAALAYGTESIPRVHKVLGPGSSYVTAAKRLVSSIVDIGLPAGPSESLILADSHADPWKVALDLLVEAEHGSDSAALLITDSKKLAEKTAEHLEFLSEQLPEPRKTFVRDVFSGYGGIFTVASLEEGCGIVNDFAPEHLCLHTREPFETLGLIKNAGEILLGENVPFSAANYASGVNAVLPTGGFARTYGAVSVRDFIKYSSVVYATPKGFSALKPHVEILADYEGFSAHAMAFRKRETPEKY